MKPILVTGGAGFIGSNLIKNFLKNNQNVICLDNFSTGNLINIKNFLDNPNFTLIEHDVTKKIDIEASQIWHLACPASPINYQKDPIYTSRTNFLGTINMLEIARKLNIKFLFASSSEVYGVPENNTQDESYNGSVNPIGVRSCYTEGKRIAESLCFDYRRVHNIDIKIARIFNTYGPNMLPNDGRVICNFIHNAILDKNLIINGSGKQTRSFCYVDDLIEGLIKFMKLNHNGPMNFGNPMEEYSINQIAELIKNKLNPNIDIENREACIDDPRKRKPNIELAKKLLNWEPELSFETGLNRTINYFKEIL